MRELLRLSRLADEHSIDEFRDPRNIAHQELMGIIARLTRKGPNPGRLGVVHARN